MICAAFGTVRGNLPALQAVLNAIDNEGIQTILNTGDSAVGHPRPNEVIQLLRHRNIPSVQGELDRLLVRIRRKQKTFQDRLDPTEYAALEDTFSRCASENIEWLRGLPRAREITVDGIAIYLCHGLLTTQSHALEPDSPTEQFRRQREIHPAPIIVSGRSPKPFARTVDGTLFVNPGRVSNGAEAHYAIISTEQEPWSAEFRAVQYNPAPAENP